MEKAQHRPRIETLACPYDDCYLYSRKGAGNLTVRKVYGKERIRYLRCRACSREFSERKNTALLFNSKIEESKAISVAEHLSEGVSMKGTSRLVGVSPEVVRRLRRNLGDHSKEFHDERVRDIEATSVQMDERNGYAKSKNEPFWEATSIDPHSRLLIGFVAGKRDASLIEELMESTKRRLRDPRDLLVTTDGEKSYESLFPSVSSGSPTARRATDEEDASRKSDTESTGASPTSNSSSVGRAQESWRSSPGRRTALGGGWRRSWGSWVTTRAQPLGH
jgi:transposase-like protein/IS1 family transposase